MRAVQLPLLRVYAAFTYPFACVPFLYFYFLDQGVTPAQYGTLISVYYLSMVLVEIPTGILADRYGRKAAMVIGPAVLSVGFCVIYANSDFVSFCIGEAVLGLGHSILSGPPSALLFEKLRRAGRAGEFQRQESRLHALRLTATGTSFLVGGWLAARAGIAPSILLTAVLCAVASLAAVFLRDVPRVPAPSGEVSLFRSAGRDLRDPQVIWVLLYFVLLFVLLRFPFHTYQPFLLASNERDPLVIGVLFFALNMFAAPCSRFAPYLLQRLGARALFWAMPLSLAISLLIMAGQLNAFGIALFFAHQIPFGMHWALIQDFVNHRIRDASRATVLSVLSFAGRLIFAIVFPFTMGLDTVSLSYFFVGVCGIVATAAIMVPGSRFLR